MYIKSIEICGFKSYGNRVLITGFDPNFNAITGLNGTGKSNILDAICFVLGITNLSNVRATSLPELIYKQGQAGITSASVTITFDNTNKDQRPIGYTDDEISVYRQVSMGNKTKYKINGHTVPNKRVTDLFGSVQMNVNNPHFLIMQGRITKVLNMKAPEILSLVEEASGTKMYETKKQHAQQIIEKKDEKLRELNTIIQENIAPKLQKLHDERAQYQEYQKVLRELDNLSKLHTAWKYVTAEAKTKEADIKLRELEEAINQKKDSIKADEQEINEIEENIAETNAALDKESGGLLKQLETEMGALERAEASAAAGLRAAEDEVHSQRRRALLLERELAGDRELLAAKEAELEKVASSFEKSRAASEAAEAALATAQQRFLAVSSGQEADSTSLHDRLQGARREAAEAQARARRAALEREQAERRLRTLRAEFREVAADHRRDRDLLDKHQAQVDAMQAQLSQMKYDEPRHSALRSRVRALQQAGRARRDAVDVLAARLQRADFRCATPPDFDSRRIIGTICQLFQMTDPVYSLALEKAAGGKLYYLVVDTEETSRWVLEHGNLRSRIVMVPLSKMQTRVVDARTVAAAQEIAGGADRVKLALELVTFGEEMRPALEFAFGGTLVCRDLDTARRVTYHPRVNTRCVTLDGDVLDPQGTLSGGARPQGPFVLEQLAELGAARAQLAEDEAALARDSAALQAEQRLYEEYHKLHQKYEMMCHELQVVKSRVATTTHAQLHDEIETLEKQISELKEASERDTAVQNEATARAEDLEAKVKDIRNHREREFKKAEQELEAAKKEISQYGETWQRRTQEVESLRLEASELRAAVEENTRQREEAAAAADQLQQRVVAAQHDLALHTAAMEQMQARVLRVKEEMSARSDAVRKLAARREKRAARAREGRLAAEELALGLRDLRTEAERCRKLMESLERENPWIASQRHYFGAPGGLFDFEAQQAAASGERLKRLTERRDRLARGVNARAHTLLSKEEEQYQDLLSKKSIVEADRAKLMQVMKELDEKKRITMLSACNRVNRDFGIIFSTLLPGAQAQLQAPRGATVLEGLELMVGFNGTWKKSLNELSGGQRSLVALSLVLAMLLFKPAPVYILDEVDAALDLSHTQNIGLLLRKHFRHSQFLIVSLKEGMFNNANVLFRTRFVDGMSSVQRFDNTRLN